MEKICRTNKAMPYRMVSLLLLVSLLIGICQPSSDFFLSAFAEGGIDVSLTKTVNGQPIADTAYAGLAGDMTYTIYPAEYSPVGSEGFVIGAEAVDAVKLNPVSGKIAFTVPERGWYAVVESLSGSAALTFAANEPIIIYVGPDGVMGAVEKANSGGTYTTQHFGGYALGLKLIYNDGYVVSGTKPDNSGQAFTTEKFMVFMPDGSSGLSFCADLGAHNIFGNYIFDSDNHNFSDDQLYFLIAAFDYINALFPLVISPSDNSNSVYGKALAQIVLWNMILKIDMVERDGVLTNNAGYADDWWAFLHFPEYVEVDRIEGTDDWYNNCPAILGGMSYKELVDDILNDLTDNGGKKYTGIYKAKDEPDVSGVVFIKGSPDSGKDPIDQQRQLFVLFGGGLDFDSTLYYDVALRKWVSEVKRDGDTVYGPSDVNTDVPSVKAGDKVTFTIAVYNQTDNPTWVSNLVDYVPAGYKYLASDNENLWGTENLDGPAELTYNGGVFRLNDSGSIKPLSIVLEVLPGADGTVLRNAAEVLEIRDDKNEIVKDIDSTFTNDERARWDRRKEKDNEIREKGKKGGDKDDYDFAEALLSEKLDITVTKIWDDDYNAYKLRPDSVTVYLKSDGLTIRTGILDANNDWTLTFYNLPDDGSVYTVEEEPLAESEYKEPKISGSVSSGFAVTNEVIVPTTSVKASKVWVDGSDAGRPADITFILLQNGAELDRQTISGDEHTFDDLPVYDKNGDKYDYTVTEEAVDGYSAAVSGTAESGFTVTNTLTTQIAGTKTWVDKHNGESDYFKVRPGSVTINLLRDGEVICSQSVTGSGDEWDYSFTEDRWGIPLPKYSPDDRLYAYTITEEPVFGYSMDINGYLITNTLDYASHVITILVKKEWVDGGVGGRPDVVVVELYKNGVLQSDPHGPIELTADKGWEGAFEDLEADEDIFYMVKEQSADWSTSYDYTVFMEGDTESGEGNTVLATITNTWIPPTTSVSGTKAWADNGNSERTRPTSIEVILLRDGAEFQRQTVKGSGDTWTYDFIGLPVYDSRDTQHYVQYTYTVEELTVPLYDSANAGFNFTNTLVLNLETVTVSGRKSWNLGGYTGDGIPSQTDIDGDVTIEVTLWQKAPGEDAVFINTIDVTAPWTYEFNDLPKYVDGKMWLKYEYFVSETGWEGPYADKFNASWSGMNITNTLDVSGETTGLEITKVWVDNGNAYSTRPSEIELILYQNGKVFASDYTTAVNAGGSWTCTFENLPKYNEVTFRENIYTVDEAAPDGYYKSFSADGLTITNTMAPGETSVSVEKKWVDDIDLSKRPETLTVYLLRREIGGVDENWKSLAEVTLTRYRWNYSWTKLPLYSENLLPYEYSVEEGSAAIDGVPGYSMGEFYITPPAIGDDNSFVITNSRKGKNITVKKVWDDSGNAAKFRPNVIAIELWQDGGLREIRNIIGSSWECTFVIPEDDDYTFTIRELAVPGYNVSYTGNPDSGLVTITNKIKPVSVELEAKKTVSGDGATLKNEQFSFAVYSGSAAVATGSNDGDGNIKFKAISFNAPGEYEYTIKETSASGGRWTVDDTAYKVTVTVTAGKNELLASVAYEGLAAGELPVFVNTYTPGGVILTPTPTPTPPPDDGPEETPPPTPEVTPTPPVETTPPPEESPEPPEESTPPEETEPPEESPPPQRREISNTPGGADPDIPPNPSVPGHELIADGDGWIELDDDGVPLGRWDWDPDEEMWIFDEFPPLAGLLPKTADTAAPMQLFIWLVFSLSGMGAILQIFTRKRGKYGK